MVKQAVFGTEVDIDIPNERFPTPDEIFAIEESLGPHCQHGWFDSCYEHAKLHYRKWLPSKSTKPKAVIIFMHGFSAHSGRALVLKNGRKLKVALAVDAFLKEDYAVYGFDLFGHGFSEGTRMWIPETWRNHLTDYLNFIRKVSKEIPVDVPLLLMGESYGSALTLMAAREFQDHPNEAPPNFDSIILTAPAIICDQPPYAFVIFLRYVLAPLFPKWAPCFMPDPISPHRIWRDPNVVLEYIKQSQHTLDRSNTPFRLGTAANILSALEYVRSVAIPGLSVPYCILHGTKDEAVPIAGSEFLWAHSSTPNKDRVFHYLKGAYHDILADPDAETAIGFVVDWIKDRLRRKGRDDEVNI